MSCARSMTAEERLKIIGGPDVATSDAISWDKHQTAAFLGVSPRTVDALPIPRANIGGPRYVPSIVRRWLLLQLDHQLPPEAA